MSTPSANPIPPPSRAQEPAVCPICFDAGRLPSMQVAGLTEPCPRCEASSADEKAEPTCPEGRRTTDRSATDVLLALGVGLALGAASVLLLVGILRMFGA